MSKRKWKVYTTEELKDRFQPKPGQPNIANEEDPQKIVVPNLKRRNSAPPGMIHFPPGTFSSGSAQNRNTHSPQPHQQQQSPILLPRQSGGGQQGTGQGSGHQQHELVTHAARQSPSLKQQPSTSPYPYPSRRRASLPYIPPDLPYNTSHHFSGSSSSSSVPAIEAYLTHLQNIPLPHQPELDMHDDDSYSPRASPSPLASTSSGMNKQHGTTGDDTHSPQQQSLPSFQSFLQTIREDADEEDTEICEIEERAMQGSKNLPTFKNIPQNNTQNQDNEQQAGSHSPSSKFYKNVSKSNDNIPALSRMSISDIIG